jgi:SAM-dependent methyltransferase
VFNNAINRQDVDSMVRRVRRDPARLFGRIAPARKRTTKTWDGFEAIGHVPPYDLPAFQARQREKLGAGDAGGFAETLTSRYLNGRSALIGLSIGCGVGAKERAWAATGVFDRLRAFDLSPDLIRRAQERATAAGLGDVLEFFVADAREYDPGESGCDVLIGDSSLHHVKGLDEFVPRAARWLRPDGYAFVREYVGPPRMQWTPMQVAEAQVLLDEIPEPLRRLPDGRVKRRVFRPGRLRMWFIDPSEAVESHRILPALDASMERIELVDQGGTLATPVFDGIAHHFMDGQDAAAQRIVAGVLDREDELVAAARLTPDNVIAAYRLRSA